MADYWKSTPKYWCKHCATYVADTKLGRANHEATGKHQSAVRRALRDLHRDHERQEREKEKAQREVARLNGLVGGGKGSPGASKPDTPARPPPKGVAPAPPPTAGAGAAPRHEQLEQLAELGVSIPDAFRGELAMAGDWTVTTTRVVEEEEGGERKDGGSSSSAAAARAVGVRKRPRGTGDDDEGGGGLLSGGDPGHAAFDKLDVDAAVQGLFKRPKKWGRDSRTMPGGGEGEGDLDSLLSGALAARPPAKREPKKDEEIKDEEGNEVKKEPETKAEENDTSDAVESTNPPPPTTRIKQEEGDDSGQAAVGKDGLAPLSELPGGQGDEAKGSVAPAEAVLFKKRKAKTVRHK